MGLACTKSKAPEEGEPPTIVRLSPFRPRRCSSLRRRSADGGTDGGEGCGPPSLLSLAVDALAGSLQQQRSEQLRRLPPDLSQLLLDSLVAQGLLNDATVLKLSGLGLHFFSLPLAAYPELVRPFWLRWLRSDSLEAADLCKTGVTDEALAALGCPAHLTCLRLDYCVDVTDAGLALLQGVSTLQELSLTGCEQLTALGLRSLGGLTRMRRLSLQTCNQVSGLAQLQRMQQLEVLDLGWCRAVGDADAAALGRLPHLRELNLARTQVTDAGLGQLHTLSQLQSLNLAGLHASDEALAALLCQLHHLQVLSLERCTDAGDEVLAALSKHVSWMRTCAAVSVAYAALAFCCWCMAVGPKHVS
jgi:hypothetical protein